MTNRPRPQSRSNAATRKQQEQRRKRNTKIVVGAVIVVLVVSLVAALTLGNSSTSSAKLTPPTGSAAAAVISQVTSVPATVTDAVGTGSATGAPSALTGDALTANGKPSLLFVGAEWCPFCGGERWVIVDALSRFGTFSGLAFTHSSTSDVHPNTQTFTFRDAKFTSQYINFDAVEVQDSDRQTLDVPTDAQNAVWAAADPNQSFPFLDIGGRFLVNEATYDVSVLGNKSAAAIAGALTDPTSSIAKGVLGSANLLTASICALTTQQPAAVCNAAGVKAAAAELPASAG
ncbi:MAG TPA: DUF929 family protein [Ilumatobacteraceae bacterium]